MGCGNDKFDNYNNYIVAEININEDKINKDIKIINSFENTKREDHFEDMKEDNKYENEKEIKEKCIIKINNKIIKFKYYYKFTKIGKYKIEYLFNENLEKTDYMFYGCSYLTNINLSNFNTQNVNNMSSMFYGCSSLTNINLSNFNTQNVINMSSMFYKCSSLTNKVIVECKKF